jgi:subtilisin family serine protease
MRKRCLGLLGAITLALCPAAASAGTVEQGVLDAVSGGGKASFWIVFAAGPDLSAASRIRDWAERGRFVHRALTDTAARSQARVTGHLAAEGYSFQSFWINNSILVTGDQALVNTVAPWREVSSIRSVRTFDVPTPMPGEEQSSIDGVNWNISAVNADHVWGSTNGQGIVVANIDTGVEYTHPALVGQYRGNMGAGEFDHNYNWYDPSGYCGVPATAPCDNYGHGTHTMGTMVGTLDGMGSSIGVAPGALWIAVKGCELNTCSDASLLASAQWVLAPTDLEGRNPDPDRRPHVVNNSWGSALGGSDWYRSAVQAWVAAGMFPAFSIGNNGPSCGTASSPGDYPESYASGAFNSAFAVPSFSARGPSALDGGIKPDISAPGQAVWSSVPGGGYASYNGTSMASPHTAGVVALLWSASPALLGDIENTRRILDQSAVNVSSLGCGGTAGDNNVWGEGRLDALAAYNLAPVGPSGYVQGTVTGTGGTPAVAGARVDIAGTGWSRTLYTNESGFYQSTLPVGTYDFTASQYGYAPSAFSAEVMAGAVTVRDVELSPGVMTTVSGRVTDGSGQGWPLAARIDIATPGFSTTVFSDPATGEYDVELQDALTYEFTVASFGYQDASRAVTPAGATTADFALLVKAACTAPGYAVTLRESFDSWPLTGWSVVDNAGFDVAWASSTAYGSLNWTGGTGEAATCNSDAKGWLEFDSSLVSPTIPVGGGSTLTYLANYQDYGDYLNLDINVDGGGWTTILSWMTHYGGFFSTPGEAVSIDLAPYTAGGSSYQLRWHYFDPGTGDWNYYAQIDDVMIGDCLPVQGIGLVVGRVLEDNNGTVLSGDPRVTVTDEAGLSALYAGTFYAYAAAAPSVELTARTSRSGYGSQTVTVPVTLGGVVIQDFRLPAGWVSIAPQSMELTLLKGETAQRTLVLENTGGLAADVRIFESFATGTGPFPGGLQESPGGWILPGHEDATSNIVDPAQVEKYRLDGRLPAGWGDVPPAIGAPASGRSAVTATFVPGLPAPWGIGFNLQDGDVWVGNTSAGNTASGGYGHANYRYLTDGTPTDDVIDISGWVGTFAADMTYDPFNGTLWQVNVGGDNCIHELDPADGISTGNTICPAWVTSQRGLAYDPVTDTFFAGGWNDRMIHRFDRAGTLLESVFVGLPTAGLAYNPATGHLLSYTSGMPWDIYVMDVNNGYRVINFIDISPMIGSSGAGLEIDCEGNLWAVGLGTNMVFEINSGETGVCDFWNDVPWLSANPPSGTVDSSGTAEVTVTVDTNDPFITKGTFRASLRATNSTPYGTLTVPVVLTVPNTAPLFPAVGHQRTCEGSLLSFTLAATDVNRDPLTFSSTALPNGAVLDSATGAFTWTPDPEQWGAFPITFSVSDGEAMVSQDVIITVTTLPVLHPVGHKVTVAGHPLSFTLSGSDADGDPMTFGATGLPDGATLDPTTGAFLWTPTATGYHEITFSLTAGPCGAVTETVFISVVQDRKPYLSPVGPQRVREGLPLRVALDAYDPEGDALTFAATPLPDGAVFDGDAGVFTWTPGYEQSGTYEVTFSVSDGARSDSEVVTITVTNHGPLFAETFDDGTGAVDYDWVLLSGRWSVDRLNRFGSSPLTGGTAVIGDPAVRGFSTGRIKATLTLTRTGTAPPGVTLFFGYRLVGGKPAYRYVKITGKKLLLMDTDKAGTSVPLTFALKQAYSLAIDIEPGGLVSVTVDGTPAVSYNFGSDAAGRIGLKAAATRSFIDDIGVWDVIH